MYSFFRILRLYLSYLIIQKCNGVSLDYYLEDKFSTEKNDYTEDSAVVQDSASLENNEFIEGAVPLTNTRTSKNNTESNNSISNSSLSYDVGTVITSSSIPQKGTTETEVYESFEDIMLLEDYYGEISQSDFRKKFKITEGEKDIKKNVKETSENLPKKNESRISNPDIYNLNPAVSSFQIEEKTPFANQSFNRWYALDRIPCWDLPIVYGEFGKQYKGPDSRHVVFGPYTVLLNNVVEAYHTVQNDLNYNQPPIVNPQWCSIPPCYGDHTLCLYPQPKYAPICSPQYSVKITKRKERIALVSKLNSIRNHVAKGTPDEYPYLPPATNMMQVLYDVDLELMSARWLQQCLPGPAPCASLEHDTVKQLECTKFSDKCCKTRINSLFLKTKDSHKQCIPDINCNLDPYIGCIHTWFWSGDNNLELTDVKCGHIKYNTFSLAQLLWAKTSKIGCASGHNLASGDVRVVCSFAPGASYFIATEYFCGLVGYKAYKTQNPSILDMTDLDYLEYLGFSLSAEHSTNYSIYKADKEKPATFLSGENSWGISALRNNYKENWIRRTMEDWSNGSYSMNARLTTRYTFWDESEAKCDSNRPIYVVGPPGSHCIETSRVFFALCYEFRDPYPQYRLIAVLAPIALFTLIFIDLFSGVVRQAYR